MKTNKSIEKKEKKKIFSIYSSISYILILFTFYWNYSGRLTTQLVPKEQSVKHKLWFLSLIFFSC